MGSARFREENRGRLREEGRIRARIQQAQLAELKAHPCVDCGVQHIPAVMEFDHVRGVKKYAIKASKMARRDLPEELAKCELRCANCHRIRHAEERQHA